MLNLDETLETATNYYVQRDLILKIFLYSIGVISLLETIRQQVPEIRLLQLIPGYYLLLLFSLFLFVLFFSDFNENFSLQLEMKKEFGTKTPSKINSFSFLKTAYLFFILTFCSGFTTIIPLSLDSFNSYGEKNIENIWSFDEVINIEIILLFILFFISQFPTIILIVFGNEKEKKTFLQFWKTISFFIFIFSGILTPTIDGYTQLGFALFAFSFYIGIFIFLTKRINVKFNGVTNLGF
jgi:hypothetical protein